MWLRTYESTVSGNDKSTPVLTSDLTVGGILPIGAPPAGAAIPFFEVSCDPGQLRREASALHWAAFGREVPEEVAQRYAEAHGVALLRVDITQSRWMQRVLEEGTDLEALEFALRTRRPDHVLCRKLKLLIYITEAFPEYYTDFVNEAPRRVGAFFRLALHGVRTLCKQLKAWWLLRSFV
jgi:hypothetical protein